MKLTNMLVDLSGDELPLASHVFSDRNLKVIRIELVA